ncbi:carboxyl transferase domain-containing protein [Pyruvatibacter sp.]|uniref:acetyl-CoA carboxylase family protein n=1 Tax=Pyruvatibacter sp. TaxID=1981328 RepID=UPI0032ECEBF7
MPAIKKCLIANRGEIAVRVLRSAAACDIQTVAVHSPDDAAGLHVSLADEAVALPGAGVAAYLDVAAIVRIAVEAGCDAVHPGYGLLAESAALSAACDEAGLIFVGPTSATLAQLGDKVQARDIAMANGLPVIEGSPVLSDEAAAQAFFASLEGAPAILKAVAGGGGRGMRIIETASDIAPAFAQASAEALSAFGDGALYMERYLPNARHIEVQIAGDGNDVAHLWERDCTLQRRHQKIIELAPAPNLAPDLRRRMLDAAVALGAAADYRGLGTIEFLLDASVEGDDAPFYFIECNPRIQVEHTVTEEITGLDLVAVQFRLAAGDSIAACGLERLPVPVASAVQMRINTESMADDGSVRPAGGTLTRFDVPGGPGVRVDSHGYAGYSTNPQFDSLLAKLIVRRGDQNWPALMRQAYRALGEFAIGGVDTNQTFLRALAGDARLAQWKVDTQFIARESAALVDVAANDAGLRAAGKNASVATASPKVDAPDGTVGATAPLQGLLVSILVSEGDAVRAGQEVAVLEAMKMQHAVTAPRGGTVQMLAAHPGTVLDEDAAVLFIAPGGDADADRVAAADIDLDFIRPDLAELHARINKTLDFERQAAVAKRHKLGFRTARENVADLCDDDTFIEYGQMVLAAQRNRRELDDLITNTPGDGMVAGFGAINGDRYDETTSRAAVLAYDYTVLAGTQGYFNHKKTDRVLELADKWHVPVVFFTEGGGGRPGDTDVRNVSATGLDVKTFATFAASSGAAPRIAINNGRCFAGNAVIFGCADVTIATKSSAIGMGGPAMIEGGGLGVYKPDEIGPIDVQANNGVVDLVADDEADAVAQAKQLLGYFQGAHPDWTCADQRRLRHVIPEDRKRVYDMREAIALIADEGSVLELRAGYGRGMITAFVRVEGRVFGLFANDPKYLGGAIDAQASEKAGRFMQLCDAFGIPLLSLCDTPGFMVGPDHEELATVRRASSMLVTGASISVPLFMICLRKGYGLGAQAMAGGSFTSPVFLISWPTGEYGGMGLEGAVRLGYSKELAAAESTEARDALFEKLLAAYYEHGKALSVSTLHEIDAVIDPMETRRWIINGIKTIPVEAASRTRRRPFVDTW